MDRQQGPGGNNAPYRRQPAGERMKTSIALIGFMGTGKTTVGKILAQKLGKEFIELDALIEKKAGKSIPAVFRDDGEIAFREIEIEVTREIAGKRNAVISCGGGIVLNKINIDRLAIECVIICLTASPPVILQRTGDGTGRPLLMVKGRASRIEQLLKMRQYYYKVASDITVNTSRLTPEGVAQRIIEKVRKYEGFDK
jgi:shikimate kinase